MITLLISIVCLIVGYFVYGKVVEKVFGPDPSAKTPAYTKQDGKIGRASCRERVFMMV